MGNGMLASSLLQNLSRRRLHTIITKTSSLIDGQHNLRVALEEELKTNIPKKTSEACIYKVPKNMRDVEPKAYSPNIISIGPYHHGAEDLRKMEELKWRFFHRLFDPSNPINGLKLEPVIDAMEELEPETRRCYADAASQLSNQKFIKMMLIDGCFVVELLRELSKHNFTHGSPFFKRWMLPILRRDLIMLENQLPLFVLQKLFQLTSKNTSRDSNTSLNELALRFFSPLLQRDPNNPICNGVKEEIGGKHFLDLLRSRILPRSALEEEKADINSERLTQLPQTAMTILRSVSELNEAGVMVMEGKNCPQLDVQSEGRYLFIPSLYINDHRGTLLRNLVAFEQCHWVCKSHVTAYLFFFDRLINSAEDVELLHYKGIIHHSLGSDKEVARLINSLCKDVAWDAQRSYVDAVIWDINDYLVSIYAGIRARLVHHYFSSWAVGISTIAAFLALYLTLVQTGCGVVGSEVRLTKDMFRSGLIDSFLLLFLDPSSSTKEKPNSSE